MCAAFHLEFESLKTTQGLVRGPALLNLALSPPCAPQADLLTACPRPPLPSLRAETDVFQEAAPDLLNVGALSCVTVTDTDLRHAA